MSTTTNPKVTGQVDYASIPIFTTAPSNPLEGSVYYNSTLHKLQVRTASARETITSA